MFNLLKSSKTTITEIHNELDYAQDRLLKEANIIIKSNPINEEKAARLAAIGFTNSEEVIGVGEVVKSIKLAQTIHYYKQNYPFQKFITIGELNRICKKYNLIYGPVSSYKKGVPDKNIKEIEQVPVLKAGDVDSPYVIYKCSCAKGLSIAEKIELMKGIKIPFYEYESQRNSYNLTKYFGRPIKATYETMDYSEETVYPYGLFIAAPKSHFNKNGLTQKGFGLLNVSFLEIKDPIVFRFVRDGVQIITKWGLEASDKALINEIDN